MRNVSLVAAGLLSAVVSANAQITRLHCYDWGWSYQLEMPETGLRCEFPDKPVVRGLENGWMTAASLNDELFVVAHLRMAPTATAQQETEQFMRVLQQKTGLGTDQLTWAPETTENGYLTLTANAEGGYASMHVDAIQTEDIVTVFLYTHHGALTLPGYFFARSYSVKELAPGCETALANTRTCKPKVVEYDSNRCVVRLDGSKVKTEWPDVPKMEAGRHDAAYTLQRHGSEYAVRTVQVQPDLSYICFNTFVNKEHQRMTKQSGLTLTEDHIEVASETEDGNESFFRKLTYTGNGTIKHCYYVAANGQLLVQELTTKSSPRASETRFLNTFDQSVRNLFDAPVFVAGRP